MISDDVGSHNQMAQEHSWKILLELPLLRDTDNACWAVDQAIEAMQPLNWPVAHLERLKLALINTTWNVMERSRLSGSEASLLIRVLIPEDDGMTQEAGQANDESCQHQVSEGADQKSSRGWGFFLVQKQGGDLQASVEESQYVIELFLYQERKHSRK